MRAVRTILTKARHKAIVEAVRNGLPFAQACVLSGIGRTTGLEWLQRGRGEHKRKKTPVFVAFAKAIEYAEAEGEYELLKEIRDCGQPHEVQAVKVVERKSGVIETTTTTTTKRDWKPLMTLLERKYPDRYGKKWNPQENADDEPPKVVNLPAGGPGE